ncbi:hypothetical protein AB0D94_37490 [Streptomyces sp. NPDC048255]|uniref:hypothetical protein n=1 Tax=Streptomyces sp. NPDC048255 TaxID=3154713 RepID=UPI0034075B6E
MGRQIQVPGAVLAAALLLVSAAGCSGPSAPGGPDGKPSASRTAPATPAPPAAPPAADGKPAGADVLPGMVDAAVARTQLAALRVAPVGTMAGYSRAKFTHWAEQGNKCDTRETVLRRDGAGVTQDTECRAVSGTWKSLYDGVVVTEAAKMDIDHMVSVPATA